jgi:hypothetical protein
LACGEDRALVSRLTAAGARVRHCLQTRVITSCRLEGRAAGGAADTMRQRIAEPESFCDAVLEPALDATRRYFWRGLVRRWHRQAWLADNLVWAASVGISAENTADVAHLPDFAALWEAVTSQSPQLVSRLLRPDELPEEISRAKRIVSILRRGGLAPVLNARLPTARSRIWSSGGDADCLYQDIEPIMLILQMLPGLERASCKVQNAIVYLVPGQWKVGLSGPMNERA